VKCTPGRCAELLEIEGLRRAPYIGKHDCVELERMDLLRDAEMREVIAESYQNIRSKLPRSMQAKLEEKEQRVPHRVKRRKSEAKSQK
jgi:predicted DNA-binding protein (MmcQ/YjbR family)